ncbi:uncharacterized protein [Elaeis guineensis]|uniref:uncharacterized protein isoform X2 n=1 Tax=Elaeis guineensis var. tenera TaxID=51953 RepID=UPI003C6CEF7D
MFLWDNVILVLQQRFFEALFPSYSRLAAKFLQVVRVEGQTMSNDVCVHGFYMLQGVRVEGQTMSNDVCVHGFYMLQGFAWVEIVSIVVQFGLRLY